MSRKKFKIKLLIIISVISGLILSFMIYFESNKVDICLNGWILSDSKNLVSSGWADSGPWIIIKNEDGFYRYMSNRGRITRLDINDVRFAPQELTVFSIIGNEAIRVEVDAGQYIYVVKKDSTIAAWSISL